MVTVMEDRCCKVGAMWQYGGGVTTWERRDNVGAAWLHGMVVVTREQCDNTGAVWYG